MDVVGHRRPHHLGGLSDTTAARRKAFERRQRRRSNAIAAASTTLAAVALVVLIPRAPGWERVQRSFFDGDVLRNSFPRLISAFWLNIKILAWSAPSVLALSLVVALARKSRAPALLPARLLGAAFVDVFRGIPTILVIFLIGFGVPGALQMPRPWNSPLLWGSVALVVSYAAYVAEIIRSGIESVPEQQRAAARSLGMTTGQTLRSVVLPQAFRSIVPPMLNSFISLQKDVALVGLLGPIELLRRSQIDTARTFNFTPYVGAALIFLAATIPLTRLADWLMARQQRRTSGTLVG
jgi:polar amino acid transport system permease protein